MRRAREEVKDRAYTHRDAGTRRRATPPRPERVFRPVPLSNPKTLYDVLGVGRGCSAADLKKSYKRLALQHHPDRNESDTTELMTRINGAYAVLGDPGQRASYDLTLGR